MLYAVLVPNSLKPDKFEINVFLATILLLFCQYCKILRITYYVLRITYEVTLYICKDCYSNLHTADMVVSRVTQADKCVSSDSCVSM